MVRDKSAIDFLNFDCWTNNRRQSPFSLCVFSVRSKWDRDGSSRSWTVKTGGGPSQRLEGLFDERRRIEEA